MQRSGYETLFNRDFNTDGTIGDVITDENDDGLVDGSMRLHIKFTTKPTH